MARFRLRYQSTDLELPFGDFVVGRSSRCHLALDDALVSRQHAVFKVSQELVSVEDLGSRNGVMVNGRQLDGSRKLKHLDRIVIGSQELLIIQVVDKGSTGSAHRPTLAKQGSRATPQSDTMPEPDEATQQRNESVLERLAEKSLALGRFDEAERMLERKLLEMLDDAQRGKTPDTRRLGMATDYALQLASGTSKSEWLDWVFHIHRHTGELLDEERISKVHELVRKMRYSESGALAAYIQVLKARASGYGPNEQFQLKRLEGILRVVSA